MKIPTLSLLMSLLLAPALYAQQAFVPVREALKTPETIKTLLIRPGSEDLRLFHEKAARFNSLEAVRVEASAGEKNWKQLLSDLARCPQLQTLELVNNGLQVLPEELAQLKKLETVRIAGNNDLYFSDAFEKMSALPRLRKLQLDDNAMNIVPGNISALRLEEFSFSGNPELNLWTTAEALKGLATLRSLGMEASQVTAVPANLGDLPALENLALTITRSERGTESAARIPAQRDEFRMPGAKGSLNVRLEVCGHALSPVEESRLLSSLQSQHKISDNTRQPSSAPGFRRTYKGVSSPVPALDVPQAAYSVNAAQGGTLSYNSGTKIFIPENAFVDAKGNPVSGPVTVDYREFRDPLDFFVSGIPMTYDTAGKTEYFESAGMFEINASVNGQEVFLAPGKKVEMDFSSTNAATSFNFYQYDAEQGGWDMIGKAGEVKENKRVQELSQAWRSFRPATVYVPQKPDTVKLDERFASDNYFYTKRYKEGVPENASVEAFRKKSFLRFVTSYKKTQVKQLVSLRRVSARDKKRTCFVFDFNRSKLPELNAFNSYVFVLDGKTSYAEFRKRFGRKQAFSDLRITAEGDQVQIEMKNRTGVTTVNATLAKLDKKDSIVELSPRAARYVVKNFNSTFAGRRRSFDKSITRELRRHYQAQELMRSAWKTAWKMVRPKMSEQEKAMSYEQWMDYYNSMQAGNEGATAVVRSLSLGSFGIYNCDQVGRMLEPLAVKADLRDEQGLKLDGRTNYVIDFRSNAMLSFGGNSFSIDQASNTALITVLDNGMLAYADQDDMIYPRSTKSMRDVKMKVVDPQQVSLSELRRRLGFASVN